MPEFCLVPGTGGNKLLANGNDLGYPVLLQGSALLLSRVTGGIAPIVDLLSMEHDPGQIEPVRSSLRAGTNVTAGPLLDLAYNQVLNDAVPFPYDWRGDIRNSARQLLDFLVANRPDDRWRLVGHSQGGLVIAAASKLHAQASGDADPSTAFSELVRDVVLIGVPLHGNVNAAHALVHGEQLGDDVAAEFVEVTRTWPSLYQMLPAWSSGLRDPAGNATHSFLDDAAWADPRYASVDRDLLARARETRQQVLDRPLEHMGNIGVTIFMARNRGTRGHAVLDDGQILFPPRDVEGDSLVPYAETLDWMTPIERNRVQASGPDEPIAEHSMLFNDPWVATFLRNILEGGAS